MCLLNQQFISRTFVARICTVLEPYQDCYVLHWVSTFRWILAMHVFDIVRAISNQRFDGFHGCFLIAQHNNRGMTETNVTRSV
ncbi:hypothetical protein WN51_09821 [Melipona quadrifasciata]|uniref:Uncharacterized protein n=1 Tax=Melipona quadrifasciata TaxID=166423 RepID=A0A0M9A587_9HYME|nr:hypothetical protein WN51_09821 [Melipona quadrifasciata]